ncbi:MAG: helix-hairpin-helix domain-containing protein [Mycoplasma sp.]
MYSYLYGQVVSTNKKTITFECNRVGYVINVANPSTFVVGDKIRIFVYDQFTTNNKNAFLQDFYGFSAYNQKELFLSLLRCNGIGPRTALNVLKSEVSLIKQLIASKDIEGLSALPNINEKLARVIIDTLHSHYLNDTEQHLDNAMVNLYSSLTNLGYDQNQIQYAIDHLPKNGSGDQSETIAEAIKLIINKDLNHEPA